MVRFRSTKILDMLFMYQCKTGRQVLPRKLSDCHYQQLSSISGKSRPGFEVEKEEKFQQNYIDKVTINRKKLNHKELL